MPVIFTGFFMFFLITLPGSLGIALAGDGVHPPQSPEEEGKLLFIGEGTEEIQPGGTFEEDGYIAIRPEGDDSTVTAIVPSECLDCEQSCLEPETAWWGETSSYGGGLVVITEEDATKCIRSDGFHPTGDVVIDLRVTNDSANELFVRVRESGALLFERYVSPNESIKQEVIPSADRHYTYSVSADPHNAQVLPAKVGFVIYRGTNDQEQMMSLVQMRTADG